MRPAHLKRGTLEASVWPSRSYPLMPGRVRLSVRPEAFPGWCPASANSSDDGAVGVGWGTQATAAGEARGLLQGANHQAKHCALVALSRGETRGTLGKPAAPPNLPRLSSIPQSRPSLSPAPVLPALLLPWRGRGRQLPRAPAPPRPHKGPSPWQPRGPERNAERGPGAIERRLRRSRYRTWGRELRGASHRPRLRRPRRSASACAPGRGGARAVPLRGGRRGPASLPCVCLSNRLGLAASAPPVGYEALGARMLGD